MKNFDLVIPTKGSTYLPGTTDQQLRYNTVGFNLTGTTKTVATWLYPEGVITGNPYISTNYSRGSSDWVWGWRLYSWSTVDRVLAFSGAGSAYKCSDTAITWNAWQHWLYTDAGNPTSSSNLTLYKDGVNAGSVGTGTEALSTLNDPFDYIIGNRPQPEGSDGVEFEGFQAHHAVWNRVLSQSEIDWLAAGKSPLWITKGLVFYDPLCSSRLINIIDNAEARKTSNIVLGDVTKSVMQPTYITDQLFWRIAITSTINLSVSNLSQSTTVEKPSLTQIKFLSIRNLSCNALVEKKTLTQTHVLNVDDLSQLNTVIKVTTTKEGALATSNLSQSSTVTKPTFTQVHNLQVDNLKNRNKPTKIILQAEGYIAVYDIYQLNSVDKIDTTIETVMSLFSLREYSWIDTINFAGGLINLTVEDLSQSNTIQAHGIFLQYATANARSLSSVSTVGHITLVQVHNLEVSNLSQSNSIDTVAVWANNNVNIKSLNQATTATKLSMVQEHNLVIPGAYIDTAVDVVYIGEWWYEIVEGVGLVTRSPDVVGYIVRSYEDYGFIRQTEEQNALIDQALEENGMIVQTYDVEGEIVREHEGTGEI